ncbi:MAG: 50S ribosomal protein L22 [Bacteroidia bacterium]|jgi:large subunit ribosomal protein L22|uniref:Large ribosomal subunit protein uL22 n=1 Tax=uncultured Sphingobacteriia bacterium TaxID=246143 RepID=F4MME3_9BACT|nr:LSU ribosomal protein L22p (L17e) [uncultured bacterium]CBL87306.1 ribosomal protein L22 [uncultured Sphingobacteriia bacterium]|tara:strand:- start:1995 stop:2378 length:384 start_codon:yes stop_codon:yes gene_type:complete
MEAIAKLNNCPMSPRKMRLVVDQIRGQRVEVALNTLKYSQKRIYAEKVEKLLKSAIANWQEVNDVRVDEETGLIVKEVSVDGGRMLKRIQPAPQGRAHRIRKRSNHITLKVDTLGSSKSNEESKSEE